MTAKERKHLCRYVRRTADLVELRDWMIRIRWENPDNPRHGADCTCTYGAKEAVIRFRDDFASWSPEDQRQTIVHELVHATRAATDAQVREDLRGHLGAQAYELFVDAYSRQMEYEVEAVASAIAKHLPLPRIRRD